jgi:glycosyltransferase involved in cell wall biosynthesis
VGGDGRADRRPRSRDRDRGDGHRDQDGSLSANPIRLLFDIQALQNQWSAERGIGRHVRELGLALGASPDLEPWYLLNRDLPVPTEMVVQFSRHGSIAHSDDPSLPRDAVYHVPSPLEPTKIDRVWPPSLRDQPFVVTLHDLIPAVFPVENMPDGGVRRVYWTRLELLRHADRVLNVSHATARDATQMLGLRQERMVVTGGGVSPDFRPPESRTAARDNLRRTRPGIKSEYVLFTGGMDYRKNVDGLLIAYAGLPKELRDGYQLVIVGRLGIEAPFGPFAEQVASLGLADRVVLTGHVSEEELILLYQGASLFVFPSRYEGFGLPVIEALACGAPAIVGRNSSLVELVDHEEALFDAGDPSSIQSALSRALTDASLLERLRRPDVRERFTWSRIAELTVGVYRDLNSLTN